jgi:hypothetical protein
MRQEPAVRMETPFGRAELARLSPAAIGWGLIALSAGFARLLLLDRAPLSESEATYAFRSWQAALGQLDGSLTDLGAPLFSHILTGIMWIFGASDIAARLLSALAGITRSRSSCRGRSIRRC